MNRKRSTLTFALSEKEEHLFALFNLKGRKGGFYRELYQTLQDYFDGKKPAPSLKEEESVGKATIMLWFDLDNELDARVRSKLMMCNYNEDTRAIIKEAILEFGKTRLPGNPVKAVEPLAKDKPKKKPPKKIDKAKTKSPKIKPTEDKKITTIKEVVSPKKETAEASRSSVPSLSKLKLDEDLNSAARLDLLGKVLSKASDVSPLAEKSTMDWAKAVEGYLAGGLFNEATANALSVAEDENEWVYDYIYSCPYLTELQSRGFTKSLDEDSAQEDHPQDHGEIFSEDTDVHSEDDLMDSVDDGFERDTGEEIDFTSQLLDIVS